MMDQYEHTAQTWDQLASSYQDHFMDLDLYNDTYDAFCRLIEKPDARIFEIGCGPGNITRYLLAKRPDFRIEAIDVAPGMVELARKNNPAAQFAVLDAREIDRLPAGFDGIMCGFCLPYLSKTDCEKLVGDCSALLNPGGVLYISAIEGDYGQSDYETSSDGQHRLYVYYYEAEFLETALRSKGFAPAEVIRKPYSKRDGSISTHLVFVAQKK